MSTQAEQTSIQTTITVDAPLERAFAVFVEDFDQVKPREHNMLGVDIAETVFEPRAGGHIYDRGVDGSECRWARVLAYEPPDRVVFTGISARTGSSRAILSGRARSRCASSPRRPSGRASSSSTATSTATARAGRACAPASSPPTAGRSTSTATPRSSRAQLQRRAEPFGVGMGVLHPGAARRSGRRRWRSPR